MKRLWVTRFRYLTAVAVVTVVFQAANSQTVMGAAPARVVAVGDRAVGNPSLDGNCDEECGPSVSCDQGCWSQADQLPSFHTVCGEYGGSPWNGFGNCIGTCGDGYCNPYNEEDDSSCYEDCGECGDNTCTPIAENSTSCYEDCGSCGDGVCSPAEVCGGSEQCATDCGSCASTGGQCDDLYDDCGSGQRCNAQQYCVVPGDRTCFDEHGCCYNEVWLEMDCEWEYAHNGWTAGQACEAQHCMVGLGCGECIPMGPMSPRKQ